MNIEDIKVGETYNVRLKVENIDEDGWLKVRTSEKAISFLLAPKELEAFSPLPKYDPCRLFRKGDKVRVVEWGGRNPVLPFMDCKVGDIGTVIKDEEATSFFVRLHLEGKYEKDMPYCHLELVTPVEELEPYSVEEDSQYWHVFYEQNGGIMTVCKFLKSYHPNAKAAAEAERDRLNAEWRKEREIRNEIIEIDKALNKEILNHADAFLTRKETK